MNRVTLIGQLAADPEVKALPSGNSVASMRVATNYSWKDEAGEWKKGADFHRVVAWAKLAEQVSQSCAKGKRVYVEGKLRTRSFTDKNNEERYVTEVVAQTVLPMDSAKIKQTEAEEVAELAEDALVTSEEVAMPMEPQAVPV